MTTYSPQARLAAIQQNKFANPLTALAVSLAEFPANREVTAQSQSDYVSGGVRENSWGPWQINLDTWGHPNNLFPQGVTQSCAMDLNCSTAAAQKISSGGTNFGDWSAFTNGSYKAELANVSSMLSNIDVPSPSAAAGSTGPAGPSGGAAGGAPSDCRVFSEIDYARAVLSNLRGYSAADIANDLGVTLDCLKSRLGQGISNATTVVNTPVLGGVAQTITGNAPTPVKSVTDFLQLAANAFRPENLWRAAFIVVGVGAVFIGGRMYLAQSPEPAQEGVPA